MVHIKNNDFIIITFTHNLVGTPTGRLEYRFYKFTKYDSVANELTDNISEIIFLIMILRLSKSKCVA